MAVTPREIILVGAGFDENTTTWGRDKSGRPALDGAVPEQCGADSSDRLPAAFVARWPAHCGESARLAKALLRHRSGPQWYSLEHGHEPRSGRYDNSRNQRSPRPELSGSWSFPARMIRDDLPPLSYRSRTIAQVPGLPRGVNSMMLLSEFSRAEDTSTSIIVCAAPLPRWTWNL